MSDKFTDRYEILARLGEGGMCEVFKARQLGFDRVVAIKVLRRALAASKESRERFKREAQNTSRLDHPNIVFVYEVGERSEPDHLPFISMQYVEGRTLGELLKEGLPLGRGLNLCLQVATALQCAHDANILHRDLKPANVFVGAKDLVKVGDWGLSKALGGAQDLTHAGVVLGTPEYMSPEQITCKPLTTRSDLYSFGVILYQVVAGRLPFGDSSMTDLLQKQLNDEPPPLQRGAPHAPEPLCQLVHAMLAKLPHHRPASATAVREQLAAVLARLPEATAAATPHAPDADGPQPRADQKTLSLKAPPAGARASRRAQPSSHHATVSLVMSRISLEPPALTLRRRLLRWVLTLAVLAAAGVAGHRWYALATLSPPSALSMALPTTPPPAVPPPALQVTEARLEALDRIALTLASAPPPGRKLHLVVADREGGGAPVTEPLTAPARAVPGRGWQLACPLLHAPSTPFTVQLVADDAGATAPSAALPLDPGPLLDELFEPLDALSGEVLGPLLRTADQARVRGMGRLRAGDRAALFAAARDKLNQDLQRAGLDDEALARLARFLGPLTRDGRSTPWSAVGQRVRPLLYLDAVLTAPDAPAAPWPDVAAALGVRFTKGSTLPGRGAGLRRVWSKDLTPPVTSAAQDLTVPLTAGDLPATLEGLAVLDLAMQRFEPTVALHVRFNDGPEFAVPNGSARSIRERGFSPTDDLVVSIPVEPSWLHARPNRLTLRLEPLPGFTPHPVVQLRAAGLRVAEGP